MARTKVGIVQSERRRRIKGVHSDIDKLTLKGERFKTIVTPNITSAELTRTIEGASTLTIGLHDPHRDLLRSRMFKSYFDVEIDDLHFRLVAISKQSSVLELTFEDRQVAYLRKYKGPEKAFRDEVTRAQFIMALVRKVREERIPVHIPELKVEQPILPPGSSSTAALPTSGMDPAEGKKAEKGIDRNANLTIQGAQANSEQLDNCEIVLNKGAEMGASQKVLVGSIACGIQEARCYNVQPGGADPGHLDSEGFFQQRPSAGWGPASEPLDKDAEQFFKKAIQQDKQSPSLSIGQLVFNVQIGASPGLYQSRVPEANRIVEAWGGGGLSGAAGAAGVKATRYAFEIEREETYWDGMGRLAEEVQWRRWVSAGVFYYASELAMYHSNPYMFIRGDEEGILEVDFDYDVGNRVTEARIRANIKEWGAPPGTVCKLGDDFGPAEGRFIVKDISSSLYSDEADITISRPTIPLPEPAPETKSVSGSGPTGGEASGSPVEALRDVKIGSAWGGTKSIFDQFIAPFMKDKGLSSTNCKRTPAENAAVGGSADSDHLTTNTNSYACDYSTGSGAGVASALAKAMGAPHNGVGTYERFNIQVDGKTFSVQILWAVQGHYDHIHVGIRVA